MRQRYVHCRNCGADVMPRTKCGACGYLHVPGERRAATPSERIAGLEAELIAERAAHARTQAEAAAMRIAMEQVRDNRACASLACGDIADRVLKGNAGHALAERVTLWRELEKVGRELHHPERCPCVICVVVAKLAALDDKKETT